jgi:hypothetical protein
VLDEVGRDNGLRSSVKRCPVEQETECRKIGRRLPLSARQRRRDVDETADQLRLRVEGDQFQGSRQADKFVRRPATADLVELAHQKRCSKSIARILRRSIIFGTLSKTLRVRVSVVGRRSWWAAATQRARGRVSRPAANHSRAGAKNQSAHPRDGAGRRSPPGGFEGLLRRGNQRI